MERPRLRVQDGRLTRTHFVIARSVATWQCRRSSGPPFGDEIATLRSQ